MSKSTIDQIREATSHELVETLLRKFDEPMFRFASPKTVRKARRVAQQRHEELYEESSMA